MVTRVPDIGSSDAVRAKLLTALSSNQLLPLVIDKTLRTLRVVSLASRRHTGDLIVITHDEVDHSTVTLTLPRAPASRASAEIIPRSTQ